MIAPIDYVPVTEGILLLNLELQRMFELDQLLISGKICPLDIVGVGRWRSQSLKPPTLWEMQLFAANVIMEQHGIEHLIEDGKTIASYVNTGETYAPTVLYDHTHERFVISSWGDFFEQWRTANIIEVSLESVANDIHALSHYPFEWEECTDGSVEDYDSVEEWLESASMDIRLRVTEGSGYEVLFGSSDFDTNHRGAWGSSSVGKCQSMETCAAIARDLIEQAADNIHLAKTITINED